MQWRWAGIAVGAAALGGLLPACSDPGDGGASGVTVTETGLDIDVDPVAGVTAWDDGFLAVTGDGEVLRSPDGERWTQLATTGLVGRDAAGTSRSLAGVAAGDGFLLAAGTLTREADEGTVQRTPLVWRSDGGERWERLEPIGLGAEALDVVVADGDGFVVFGTEEVPPPPDYEPGDEAEGEVPATIGVTSTWRSGDGTTWEKFGGNVLPPGENSVESVASVAIAGDQLLASLGTECTGCYDDYNLVLARSSEGGGTWQELDVRGLDDLEQANSDIIPRVAAFDDGYVAVGTSKDGDDTVATLWRSTDGNQWTDETRLGGPRQYEYAENIDAVVATETGVIVLELYGSRLVAWKVEL